jgi:acetaldehyde dehydrogenase/alcohol dehydrogenase
MLLTTVMKYNAVENPTKMGTFPQYAYPSCLHKYAETARELGVEGKDDRDVFNKFIEKIEALKQEVGVAPSIQAYGVKEEDFLKTLDEMSLNAFNDQCTGANPRYPLVSEIKELYLEAYYGTKKESK